MCVPAKFGNPGPLGLAAFGLTTTLLNVKNAHIIPDGAMPMIFGMGMFFGGLAQLIAGILEWIKGNTFGMVAFVGYGSFWLSFVFLHFIPSWGLAAANVPEAISAYLCAWCIFTAGMTCGTIHIRANRLLTTLFATLTILFFLLALGDAVTAFGSPHAGEIIGQIAGIEGMGVGLLSIYISQAEINGWPVFPAPPLPDAPSIQLDEAITPPPTPSVHSSPGSHHHDHGEV